VIFVGRCYSSMCNRSLKFPKYNFANHFSHLAMSTSPPSPDTSLSPNSSSKAAHEKRVTLACLRCRAKRGRCSGHKPSCHACVKANEECTWPTGRRRKRTRREMEEDERQEREAAANAGHLSTFQAPEIHPYSPMPWVSRHPIYV
jgi:hypothetical protein